MSMIEDIFWWQVEEDPHEAISDNIKIIRDEQDGFYSSLDLHMALYGGAAKGKAGTALASLSNRPRLTFNICHSLCQAAQAKIAKHKPSISFLTSGGDWSQKRKAKQLDKFMQGQIYETEAYEIAQRAFLDACIVGTGAIKIYIENKRIHLERVRLDELTLDTYEGALDSPRQLFQTKMVSRHVLASSFPDKESEILNQEDDEEEYTTTGRASGMVKCHESWHLPSAPGAGNGRHVISIDGATLLDEAYSKDDFPFVFIRWTSNPESYWGNGLIKEVKGIQVEINKLLAQIQEQMHLGTPKIFIEHGSKISSAHLNNRAWGAIEYKGTKPDFFVPRAVSGETFSHLDRLVSQAYQLTGISELAAQSKKPVGLDSGRALREFSDIESERFMVVGQAYEATFVRIAKHVIELVKGSSGYSSMSFSPDSGVEHIDWSDVDIQEDEYVMRVQPTGSLPQTPAAKLASVTEMHMNGMLTPEEAHQLLDFPDLEQSNKMRNAHLDLIDKLIDDIIDKGKYRGPEKYMNLGLGIERFQQAWNLGVIEGIPEKRVALLRRWMTQAVELVEAGKPKQEPMMPGMMPGAEGGMPPMGPMGPMPPMGEGLPPPDMLPPGMAPPPPPMPEGLPPGEAMALPPEGIPELPAAL